MNSKLFQKIDGVYAQNLLKGETVDKKELGIDSGATEGSDVVEHVYIVFADGTDIESGIALIEQQVLGGGKLEVNRKDTTGNAIVAVVESSVRKEIESLPEVSKVKINEAAEVKKNRESDSSTEETTIDTVETTEEITEEGKEATEVTEVTGATEVTEEAVVDAGYTKETEAEITPEEVLSEQTEVTTETQSTVVGTSKSANSIWIPVVIGILVLAAAAITVVRALGKKR
jgi:hypothetical protein